MQNVSIFGEMLTTGRTSSKNSQKFVYGRVFSGCVGKKKNSGCVCVCVGVGCVKGLCESQFCERVHACVHVCACVRVCMCVFSTVPEGGC